MGVFWHSHAEVISLEPEKVKQLIEEIDNDDDYDTSSIHDLMIEDNSVFFNSGGYGCYGYDEGCGDLLFQKLLEKYEGAIACFEYVQACQSQDYNFALTYIKLEGEKIDWDNFDSAHRYIFVMEEDEYSYNVIETDESHWDLVELNDSYFEFGKEEAYIWAIPTDWLEDNPSFVSLNAIYKKCGDNKAKITTSLLYSWCDDETISDDELYSAIDECKLDCLYTIQNFWDTILSDFEGELPDDFPSFKTKN